ncbi:MAG: hypothetical protein K1X81_04260 [Bacteroidia bacterium]|nr:hypothetical protein [Bacteroidia bacterium]
MKPLIVSLLLAASMAAGAQTCTKETFSSVSDRIVAEGYTIVEHKTSASVPVQGAQSYVFYVEPGNEYVFVITSLQDITKGEFIGVNISDSSGKITSRLVNDKYAEVHFTPRRAEYITIETWFRSNDKNRDRFCLYHLFAGRKLEPDGR